MSDQKAKVKSYVRRRLELWQHEPNPHQIRADLANLRRGIAKAPGDLPELWGLLFRDFPEELMSSTGEPTWAEWAVSGALTLYALHQQSRDVREENMHRRNIRLGQAVAGLVKSEDDRERVARRFNAFATAGDMQEAAYHLRGLIQLLRAENIPLDYVRLAQELYLFQDPDEAPKVRLKWGQDFYRMKKSETKEEKENA